MINITNFSHPILPARPDIEAVLGDEYQVSEVKVHLNQATPMVGQVIDLVGTAKALVGGNVRNIDVIVLPGLAVAAVLIMEEFRFFGYIPNILRLAPVPGATPPRFEAVEVIRLHQPPDNRDEGSFGPEIPPPANTTRIY